jgi:hypothetical protein
MSVSVIRAALPPPPGSAWFPSPCGGGDEVAWSRLLPLWGRWRPAGPTEGATR